MSADRQRLKSAIQRIAKEDPEIRNLLGEGKNKGGKASSSGVGTSEAEESRLCCDGSTSGNANPGTGERDPDSDSQDGLDSDDPAKLSSGDGTLSGVTDCATGEPICFDGSGFIPPEGWEDPQTPPDLGEWEADPGIFWETTSRRTDYSPIDARTKGQASSALSGQITGDEYIARIDDDGDCVRLWVQTTSGSTGSHVHSVCEMACADGDGTQASRDLYCGTTYGDPTEEELPDQVWPEDGCTNLAIKNGSIVGSKYDPENDGSYSAPRDSIDLCDSEGNQISLAPAANGGWKTINSTTSDGYLYDSSGTQIAHIDGNEYSDPSI